MSSHIGVCLSVFQGSIKQFRSAGEASRREGTQYSNLINGKRNKPESEREDGTWIRSQWWVPFRSLCVVNPCRNISLLGTAILVRNELN